jgi:hypothetical protein
MTTYERRVATSVQVEFRVSTAGRGAAHGAVTQAIRAAVRELCAEFGVDSLPADDYVTVRAEDDAVVVSYAVPDPERYHRRYAALDLGGAIGVDVDPGAENSWDDVLGVARQHSELVRMLRDRQRHVPYDDDPIPALLPRNWPAVVDDEVVGSTRTLKLRIDDWVTAAVIDGEVPPGPRGPVGDPCD